MLDKSFEKVKNYIDKQQFKKQVIAYISEYQVSEQEACKKVTERYLKVKKYSIAELEELTTTGNYPVIVVATMRGSEPIREYNFKKFMYVVFSDITGIISVKFDEEEETNQLLNYAPGQTLRIKGTYKILRSGKRILTNIEETIDVGQTSTLTPPLVELATAKPGLVDTFVRLVQVAIGEGRRPCELLVEDENYRYIIKTWNLELIDSLKEATNYSVYTLRLETNERGLNILADKQTNFVQAAEREIISRSTRTREDIVPDTANGCIVANYELLVTDVLPINYVRLGEQKSAKKYSLHSAQEQKISYVDWYNSLEAGINTTLKLSNVVVKKHYETYELVSTRFTTVQPA